MTTTAPSTTVPSLLWPPAHDRATKSQGLSTQSATDLGLHVLVRALDYDGAHSNMVRGTLQSLVADANVIRYRQAIVAELAANESLRAALAALVPQLAELGQPRSAGWTQESPLVQIPPRVSDLELYVDCIQALHTALSGDVHAPGLRALHHFVDALHNGDEVRALARELPPLREQLEQVRSLTIGLNLDRDLRPAAVTLVAINTEPFVGERSLVGRLLGREQQGGILSPKPLHTVLFGATDTSSLARDVQQVVRDVVEPVGQALERYQRINARSLAALAPEIAFYLGAVEMQRRLHAQGLSTCLPTVTDDEHVLQDAYNPILALQVESNNAAAPPLVPNPIDFAQGRVIVLTGPNRGGKTTYLRAVALNQILFQAGVFVAARDAHMSPVDAMLTHFPPLESTEPGGGRLDDEARRVRHMFDHGTARSLLLFNEPLTSTAEREALALATDVVRALRVLGARTIFVTHLHALAERIAALNNEGDGATVASWVAETTDDAPLYTIRPGTPQARSHARRIAEQHGITFDQLKLKISK